MIKNSFTLRVLVLSFYLLALPLLIDSFIFFRNDYHEAIKEAKQKVKEIALTQSLTFAEIQPIRPVLLSLINYLLNLEEEMAQPLTAEQQQVLSQQLEKHGGNMAIFILNLGEGVHYTILASSLLNQVNTEFTSYLSLKRVMAQGEGSFMRYVYSPELKQFRARLFLARVLYNPHTQSAEAILMVTEDTQETLESFFHEIEPVAYNELALLNSDGVVFAGTQKQLMGQGFELLTAEQRHAIIHSHQLGPYPLADHSLPLIHEPDSPFFEFIFQDQLHIAYRAYVPEMTLSLVAYAPKEAVFAQAIGHFLLIYALYGFILIGGGAIVYWIAFWMARPLEQLVALMTEVGHGNLHVRFQPAPYGFELNILGNIFNETLEKLLHNMQLAREERIKSQAYQRELQIGQQVQYNLLSTQMPAIKGAELACRYLPATDVGGDFYTYLKKPSSSGEEALMIVIADAADRGISSCLYALSARSLCRTYATLYEDVGEILTRTNADFEGSVREAGMFLTLFMGCYYIESRRFAYCSCGHPPPFVRRASGEIETLESKGVAIGLQENTRYVTEYVQLFPGDLVMFYTDGLVEAVNDQGEFFCAYSLQERLQQRHWESAQEFVDRIIFDLGAFTHGVAQEEEIIVMALKVSEKE